MFKFESLDTEDDSSYHPLKFLSTLYTYMFQKKLQKKETVPHFLLCFTVTHTHSPPSSSCFSGLHFSRLSMMLLRAAGDR